MYYFVTYTGKCCSVARQDLGREEEEVEVLSDTISQRTTANTQSVCCFKGCRRTQIHTKCEYSHLHGTASL